MQDVLVCYVSRRCSNLHAFDRNSTATQWLVLMLPRLLLQRPVIDALSNKIQKLDCLDDDDEHVARTDGCEVAYRCMLGGLGLLLLCALVSAARGELIVWCGRLRAKRTRFGGLLVTVCMCFLRRDCSLFLRPDCLLIFGNVAAMR